MQAHWKSIESIRRFYHRHTLRHLFTTLSVTLLTAGLLFHLFYFVSVIGNFGFVGINLLFVLSAGVLLYALIRCLALWGRHGIRLSTFSRRWEHLHPEVANRTSLLVYADQKPHEIERLGYSKVLLEADDEWLERYIGSTEKKNSLEWPMIVIAIFAIVFMASIILLSKQPSARENLDRLVSALYTHSNEISTLTLNVPDKLTVERGKPVTLSAATTGPVSAGDTYIHIGDGAAWQSISAPVQDGKISFTIPAVHRQLEYYISKGNRTSNRGRLVPLDPPTLTQGSIVIEAPAYTELPKQTLNSLRSFSIPEGSLAQIYAQSAYPLRAADFYFQNERQPVVLKDGAVQGAFTASESGEFYFHLTDSNNLTGVSQKIRVTVIPDATPTVDVVNLPSISDVPDLMVLRVSAHVKDDYRIQRVMAHSEINQKPETRRTELIWEFTPEKAKEVGSATEIYITFDWDLSRLDLFPGDELSFHMEVWDNDAIHGSKSGRSQSYLLRYPSLVDLLSQLDKAEEEQVESLSDLTEKQSDLAEDAHETLEKISEKLENTPATPEGQEEMWTEKQELEKLKERQEELVQEAKKVEEELQNFQQQAEEQLTEEQKQEQGFTPETLEKMDRIRELLSELIDKDSQQLLQKIEQTVEQLSQDVTKEKLQDLDFSFQDFNEQLERTLSMLENTQQSRQLEGLKEMATDLAERQDHLERETDKLADEMKALEEQLAQLEQNKPQEDAQNPPGQTPEDQNPPGEKTDQQNPQGEPSEEMKKWQEQKEALEKQLEELKNKESLMAERQNRIEQDTKSMLEKMGEMKENLEEKNPNLAQQLEKMQEQANENQLPQEMSKASQKLQQSKPREAQPHQQQAQKQLQEIAQQFEEQMDNMGGMEMEMDTEALKRLVDRGLFLSHEFEPLTEAQAAQKDPRISLRKAQAYLKETNRIESIWKEMAQTNPFLGRSVQDYLRRSEERLQKAVDAGQGERWLGLHESRQSLIALNQAIYNMMKDLQQMAQQQQQAGAGSMQQMMQQMISEQQGIQQMLQQMRQMGEKGEQMAEQLQKMAERQAQVRKEIEKMMQKFRHAQQLKNQLDGIYQEMKDVEKMLESGDNSEKMEEKQHRIMTRMLDAGTTQEKDELGEERKAETVKTGTEGTTTDSKVPVSLKEKLQNAVDRPDEESIPVQYREAIKNHYLHLAEQMGR